VKTHLLTNGSLINKTPHIKEIISYTDRVRVTLLGFKETHEKLTRSPGSFEAVIDGIKTLQDLNANFQVAFVPMRQNYKELPDLMEMLFKNYGVTKFRLLDLAPTGRAMEIWGHISLSIEEKVWLNKELERVSSTHGIDLSVGFHTSLSFSSLKKLKGHEICTAGITRCHVNAVGEVFPCTAATGQPILSGGNLRRFNLDLANVWRSAPVFQMLRYFRRHPPPPCNTCKWWSSCTGGCKVEMNYNYNSIAIPNPECEIVKQVKEKSGEEDVYDKS
jgi:radical SAM protein with 4Fe4S-binding SPASM domain